MTSYRKNPLYFFSLAFMLMGAAILFMYSSASAQSCAVGNGPDCNQNNVADSCDVSSGASADCNIDGVPDECELGEDEFVVSPGGITTVKSNDCDRNLVPDECEADCNNSGKPDACKDDLNSDGVADACVPQSQCQGTCDSAFPAFDEDQDGVPNCQEAADHTDACDAGSFVPRLYPAACGGPNGFFNQVNIASVINHLSRTMHVQALYRDASGVTRGSVAFDLPPNIKRDLIVNDMGLVPDSYGTLCIVTDATTLGAWSGGITIYKRRDSSATDFNGASVFDYALYYPFKNPFTGPMTLPLNTYTIGTDGLGTVANWIRLTDVITGDNKPLTGTLLYFDAAGSLLASDAVNIPNGGRQDYGAHVPLGPNAVGLAQFIPSSNGTDYYLELTRYFYEGTGAASDKFYTAFPLPIHPPTGAGVTGQAFSAPNELSIFEFVNAMNAAAAVHLNVFDSSGTELMNQAFNLPAMGTIHRVITNELQAAATPPASGALTAPRNAVDSTTVVYGFDKDGGLQYAFASPFSESAGTKQFSEFNSFIAHENVLEIINTADHPIHADVSVINYDQTVLAAFPADLAARGTLRQKLSVPADSYGTIVVDSGGEVGLVVRNDVMREGEYVMPFFGR
jgi:hypothetical protein